MTYYQSIILGIIQGASEFLPISSSGHLVLAPYLFGWDLPAKEAFLFDVLAQVATLIAVIVYFWADLLAIMKSFINNLLAGHPFQEEDSRLGWFLLLSTVPAGIAAILFKDTLEAAFSNPKYASIFLLITSLFLVLGEYAGKRIRNLSAMSWIDSLIIGVFQSLALFPGISRSGSTITGGLIRNFNRQSAARYSFLMAVPVMVAAGVMAGYDLARSPILMAKLPVYLSGFVSSAIVGYFAIKWFIGFLSRKSLYVFAIYCAVVGLGFLIFLNV